MKKILFIIGILAAHLTSAQLYTSTGTVGSTSTPTSKNVGIGVHDPHSNLEVGDQNGGKITISTGSWSASSASPKYPTLEFAGYLNSPKVRLTATEESGNTNGSKFSILVNDNTSATHLVERFSILQNGNVGIGATSPDTKLHVAQDNVNDQNLVVGKFTSFGSTGGSAIVSLAYNSATANLEVNSTYSGNGFRYGTYGDFNIEHNTPHPNFGTINFITNKKIQMAIMPNGNASLQGKFEAKEVKVTLTPTADFVFDENYSLPTLEDVEKHIKDKKHLPEIASAKVMEKEGVNVGEFQIKLLQKIEELTLYSIEQNKQLKQLQEENKVLKSQSEEITALKKQVQQLLNTKK